MVIVLSSDSILRSRNGWRCTPSALRTYPSTTPEEGSRWYRAVSASLTTTWCGQQYLHLRTGPTNLAIITL